MPEDILSRQPPPYDARLHYGPDPNQFLDLRLPAAKDRSHRPHPLVINIHGGYWRAKYNLDYAGHFCAVLATQGLATANLEYRRVGNEGGGWPGTFEDIRSAYHFLVQSVQAHHIDTTKIVIAGHSAGGQLAFCLAAHEPAITRVVSLAGVVDLRRAYEFHLSHDAVAGFLGGTPLEVPDHYREADPMQLSIPHSRQWLIQGLNDIDVPPVLSRDYVAAKQKRPGKLEEDVHLLELAAADHFDLVDPHSAAWEQVQNTILLLTQ